MKLKVDNIKNDSLLVEHIEGLMTHIERLIVEHIEELLVEHIEELIVEHIGMIISLIIEGLLNHCRLHNLRLHFVFQEQDERKNVKRVNIQPFQFVFERVHIRLFLK